MSTFLLVVNTLTVLIKSGGNEVLNTSLKGSRNAAALCSMTTALLDSWKTSKKSKPLPVRPADLILT